MDIVSDRLPLAVAGTLALTITGLSWCLWRFDLPYPRIFLMAVGAMAMIVTLLVCMFTRLPKLEILAGVVSCYASVASMVFAFFSLLAIIDSVAVRTSLDLAWQALGTSLASLLLTGTILMRGRGRRSLHLGIAAPVLVIAPLTSLVMLVRLALYFLMRSLT